MNNTDDIEEVTSDVRLIDIVQNPSAVIVEEDGNGRRIRQQIALGDSIACDFVDTVNLGDAVRLTIETNWSRKGLPTRVVAFERLNVLEPVAV